MVSAKAGGSRTQRNKLYRHTPKSARSDAVGHGKMAARPRNPARPARPADIRAGGRSGAGAGAKERPMAADTGAAETSAAVDSGAWASAAGALVASAVCGAQRLPEVEAILRGFIGRGMPLYPRAPSAYADRFCIVSGAPNLYAHRTDSTWGIWVMAQANPEGTWLPLTAEFAASSDPLAYHRPGCAWPLLHTLPQRFLFSGHKARDVSDPEDDHAAQSGVRGRPAPSEDRGTVRRPADASAWLYVDVLKFVRYRMRSILVEASGDYIWALFEEDDDQLRLHRVSLRRNAMALDPRMPTIEDRDPPAASHAADACHGEREIAVEYDESDIARGFCWDQRPGQVPESGALVLGRDAVYRHDLLTGAHNRICCASKWSIARNDADPEYIANIAGTHNLLVLTEHSVENLDMLRDESEPIYSAGKEFLHSFTIDYERQEIAIDWFTTSVIVRAPLPLRLFPAPACAPACACRASQPGAKP